MIQVAGILGVLRAGASLATAVKGFIDKTPENETNPDIDRIVDAVSNLVTQGTALYNQTRDIMTSEDEEQVKTALQNLQGENDALYQSVSAKLDAASKSE